MYRYDKFEVIQDFGTASGEEPGVFNFLDSRQRGNDDAEQLRLPVNP